MTEEQKQKARENSRRYYQRNKEEILRKQKEYRKEKLETDEEYKKKYNQRWKKFKETFKEQHPNYHKEYNKQWGKIKRNSYKTRCEKAIKYLEILREKYFRECVAGSSKDLSEIIHILEGEDNE